MKLTKNGQPFSGLAADSLNVYFTPYADGKFQFDPPMARLSLKGKLSYADGVTTSTLVELDPAAKGYIDYTDVSRTNGVLVVYGYDEKVSSIPNTRVTQEKYPFATFIQTGQGVDYVSAANNAGCVKCHTDPYLKHGNIYAQVNGDPATDFITCKACHLDNGDGGHQLWQLLVDDPAAAAAYVAAGEEGLTPEQEAKYAYKTTLMNDVHMSHAMEFAYPQSMSNCATCHEGKLDTVLSDANFKIETCKSCHPVDGAVGPVKEGEEDPSYDTTKLALKTILPEAIHGSLDLNTTDCLSCHGEGKSAKPFNQIHTGYVKSIYTATGLKYSEAITMTVDAVTFDGSKLDIQFSAAQDAALTDVDSTTITPTVLVGLFGYDTKDFIVGAHERLKDDNGDGAIDGKDSRALEFTVGKDTPRMATVSAGGGKWEVTADLSDWAAMITDGTVKRVQVGVLPVLKVNGQNLAVSATHRVFDLGANDFADDFFKPIVREVNGCNNCHDQLGTTFHQPAYGGDVAVCRMCHITKAAGSHLEMQSRSIDSYVHAIHTFQAFDIGSIDFADPVEALKYTHHTETTYPNHGTNCASCHEPGTNNVPDQSASLPGILSGSSEVKGWDRKIGTVPSYVTGPAVRACGGCHRAALINEDAAGELAVLTKHFQDGGYLIEAGEKPVDTLMGVISQMMAFFK